MAVVLRPRGHWEAMDLGFALVQRWWRPLYRNWIAFSLPIFLLLNLMPLVPFWLAALILWWLKPFFDRKVGLVTPGNSSQITDGAAVLLLASRDAVERYGLEVLGRITLALELPNGTRYSSAGRLLTSAFKFDPETGLGTVIGEFPNPKHILRPGLKVSVNAYERRE